MRHLVAAIALFVPAPAQSQLPARDTTAIPRDLATALISFGMGMSEPEIVVGRLPDA